MLLLIVMCVLVGAAAMVMTLVLDLTTAVWRDQRHCIGLPVLELLDETGEPFGRTHRLR